MLRVKLWGVLPVCLCQQARPTGNKRELALYVSQERDDGLHGGHRQLSEAAFRHGLDILEPRLMFAIAVLHGNDLAQGLKGRLHLRVVHTERRPGHSIVEKLAGKDGVGCHGRVAFEGSVCLVKDTTLAMVTRATHAVGGSKKLCYGVRTGRTVTVGSRRRCQRVTVSEGEGQLP